MMPKISASYRLSILCCLTWAAIAAYLANSNIAGVFHDDGIYLGCAKSLAEGQGYRIPGLPGQPYQTKYPPLFSLLLTPVWWIEPNFPANIWIFQAVAITSGFAFLLFSFLVFVRVFRFSERAALLLLAVLASNPLLLSVSGWILSELPYGCFSLATLLFYETRIASTAPATRLRLFILAALAASAYLVKTHGVVLALALVAVFGYEKRWRFLLKFLGFLCLFVAPWVAWAMWQSGTGQTRLSDYYVSYRDSLFRFRTLDDLSQLASVVVQNLKYMAAFLDYFHFPVIPLKHNGSWLSIIGIGVLVGIVATWKCVSKLTAAYLVGFFAFVLLLPWYPSRHLVPVLPIILGAFWLGVLRLKEALDRAGGMAGSFPKSPLARLAGRFLDQSSP